MNTSSTERALLFGGLGWEYFSRGQWPLVLRRDEPEVGTVHGQHFTFPILKLKDELPMKLYPGAGLTLLSTLSGTSWKRYLDVHHRQEVVSNPYINNIHIYV